MSLRTGCRTGVNISVFVSTGKSGFCEKMRLGPLQRAVVPVHKTSSSQLGQRHPFLPIHRPDREIEITKQPCTLVLRQFHQISGTARSKTPSHAIALALHIRAAGLVDFDLCMSVQSWFMLSKSCCVPVKLLGLRLWSIGRCCRRGITGFLCRLRALLIRLAAVIRLIMQATGDTALSHETAWRNRVS